MKIAIPHSPLFSPLLLNVEAVCEKMGWTLLRGTGDDCSTMLLNHFVDMALISPYGYGRGVGKVDYRIIPDPCLALVNYTAAAGIYFNEAASEINSIGTEHPKEFFPIIGSMLMREKFDAADTPLVQTSDLSQVDCLIDEYNSDADVIHSAMDVGEEWFDLIELPLPVGLWTCRVEADVEHVASAVKAMSRDSLTDVPIFEKEPRSPEHAPREGHITYKWSDDVESGLDSVLRMLYYYQLLPEIPAVKLLDRD